MSMNTSSDPSHQYAPINSASNFSASLSIPTTSRTPTAVQHQLQSASRDRVKRFHISKKARSYRRRTGISGAPKRPYSCNICGKAYAQPQGVTRHHREAHQVSVCTYCGDFRWGRRYQFRKHLTEWHPDVDPDVVLGRQSRCKVTVIPRYSATQQRVSTPNPEHDGRGHVDSHLFPLAPPPLAAENVIPLSPPAVMSSLVYDPQSKPAEPMTAAQTHDDPLELLLDTTYTGAAVSSTEEFAQRMNDLDSASQSGQIW